MTTETNVIFKCQICSEDKEEDRFIKLHKSAKAVTALGVITKPEQASSEE